MNSLFVDGKLAGLIMAAGSLIILLMISDLLYKGILLAADAVDAAIRNRERSNSRYASHGSGSNFPPEDQCNYGNGVFYPALPDTLFYHQNF